MDHIRVIDHFPLLKILQSASILLLVGCSSVPPLVENTPSQNENTPTPIIVKPSDGSTPITVVMTLSLAPKLGQKADLTLTFKSIFDASGTQAEITLPEGSSVDSGSVKWSGDLKAGEPVTLKATIHFTKEGNFTLEGKALSKQANGDVWGDAADIYLHVTQTSGSVGFPSQITVAPGDKMKGTPPSIYPAP